MDVFTSTLSIKKIEMGFQVMTILFVYGSANQFGNRNPSRVGERLQSFYISPVTVNRDRDRLLRHWIFHLPYGCLYFQFYHNPIESQAIGLQSVQETDIKTVANTQNEAKPNTLGAFIHAEMLRRDMTAREFAEYVGVTHSTINKFLNHGISNTYAGKPVGEPSVDFLVKLARATHTDICSLMALIAPDVTTTNAEAQVIAERIARLPPDKREIIDSFLLGLTLKGRQQGE
jgi:transcriptional regulator with XRE-family HTH domain